MKQLGASVLLALAGFLAGSLILTGCGTGKEATPTTTGPTAVPKYTVADHVAEEATLYLNDEYPGAEVNSCRADPAPDPNYLAETKDPFSRRYRARPYRCYVEWNGATYSAQAFWFGSNGLGIEASCSHNDLRVSRCSSP
jgi:hypothetical protein